MDIIFPDIDLYGVKGVLIDIDNTLYTYQPLHIQALTACYQRLTAEVTCNLTYKEFSDQYDAQRKIIVKRLENQGSCRSRLLAFQTILEDLQVELAYDKAYSYEELYWGTFMDNVQPDPKAVAFLRRCADQDTPVCAVTDMQAHIQVRKLRALGLHTLIPFLVTSEEVGIEKPDARMFKAGLAKLGLIAQDVIMVGDSGPKDIAGALALGIKGYEVKIG